MVVTYAFVPFPFVDVDDGRVLELLRNSSLFNAYIMYCIEIWGNTYATNVNCLILLDRKVVRLFFRAERLYGFLVVQKGCTVSLWCRKVVRFPCGAERLYGFLVVQKGCTVSLWCGKVGPYI